MARLRAMKHLYAYEDGEWVYGHMYVYQLRVYMVSGPLVILSLTCIYTVMIVACNAGYLMQVYIYKLIIS